jgi:protein SCO1
MRWIMQVASAAFLLASVSCQRQGTDAHSKAAPDKEVRAFQVKGVIMKLGPSSDTIVVKHEAIPAYMPAMTMPFRVRQLSEVAGLRAGDAVSFRLCVTAQESWIDQVASTLGASSSPASASAPPAAATNAPSLNLAQIPDFALTNEMGQHVSLHQFQGEAVALTFFFTRCPLPEYCPRLSRSLAEASHKLKSQANAPTNWRLLSISFDPLDRPEVLRAYAQRYGYDSNHWSFLTGDPAQVRALTHGFGISATPAEGVFNHDFRTAVFDANGQLQTLWPFGGDTSQMLVDELTKGARVKPGPGSLTLRNR